MKRPVILVLLLSLCLPVLAQRFNNPRLYYRQFHNEYIKLQRKDLHYRTAKVKEEDRDKVEKYREAVIEQIESSRKEVANMPPYKDDEMLKIGYMEGLDSLQVAYTDKLDSAFMMERYQWESYEEMADYYQYQKEAEKKIEKAFALLDQIEEEFAIVNDMGIKKDPEIRKQYEQLSKVNEHVRAISLSFYRLDHALTNFVDTIDKYTNLNLDTFYLPETVDEIAQLAEEERSRADQIENPDLKDNLHKQLMNYLKEVQSQSKKDLKKIAKNLEQEPFYTNGHRDARIDLNFFAQKYDSLSKEFLRERRSFILEYYPD